MSANDVDQGIANLGSGPMQAYDETDADFIARVKSDLARYAVLTGEDVEAVQDEDERTA